MQTVPSARGQVSSHFYSPPLQDWTNQKWTPPQELSIYSLTDWVRGKPQGEMMEENILLQKQEFRHAEKNKERHAHTPWTEVGPQFLQRRAHDGRACRGRAEVSTAAVIRFSWQPGPFVRICRVPEAAGQRHTKKIYEEYSIFNPLNRLQASGYLAQSAIGVNIFSLFSEGRCKAVGRSTPQMF